MVDEGLEKLFVLGTNAERSCAGDALPQEEADAVRMQAECKTELPRRSQHLGPYGVSFRSKATTLLGKDFFFHSFPKWLLKLLAEVVCGEMWGDVGSLAQASAESQGAGGDVHLRRT